MRASKTYSEKTRAKTPFESPLAEFVVGSASKLVSCLLEAEVTEFVNELSNLKDQNGKPRVVRNGYLPERKVKTPLGRIPVKIPRVRDRLKASSSQRIKFNSKLISPYQRSLAVSEDVVSRYLTEFVSGDWLEATATVLGNRLALTHPDIRDKIVGADQVVSQLTKDLSSKTFRYVWVDRIPYQSEIDDDPTSLVVAVGETTVGEKDLLLVFADSGSGRGLYSRVLNRLSELGLASEPPLVLSDSCLDL
jgi:putative transposase